MKTRKYYQFQVKVREPIRENGKDVMVWRSVRPSGPNTHPYTYETYEEAHRMMSMCYPDETKDSVRVIEIEKFLDPNDPNA